MIEEKMQQILDLLGIPLTVCWTPNSEKSVHGEIEGSVLFIYDTDEESSWQTFTHETLEYRFKQVLAPYRTAVNALLDVVEKTCYQRKEEFLEFLPLLFEAIEKGKKEK